MVKVLRWTMEPENLLKETEPALHCPAFEHLGRTRTDGGAHIRYLKPQISSESLGDFTHKGRLDVTEPFGLADLDRGELARPDDRRDRQPPPRTSFQPLHAIQ
jgi:hypothetical protein